MWWRQLCVTTRGSRRTPTPNEADEAADDFEQPFTRLSGRQTSSLSIRSFRLRVLFCFGLDQSIIYGSVCSCRGEIFDAG